MKSTGAGSRDQTWRHRKKNWVRSFEHGLSRSLVWTGGRLRILTAAVGKQANVSLSMTLYVVVITQALWRKAFLENLAPTVGVSFELGIASELMGLCCPGWFESFGVAIQI